MAGKSKTKVLTFDPDNFFCVGDAKGNMVYSGESELIMEALVAQGRKILAKVPDADSIQDVGGADGEMIDEWDYIIIKCDDGPLAYRVRTAGSIGATVEIRPRKTNELPLITTVDDDYEVSILIQLYVELNAPKE